MTNLHRKIVGKHDSGYIIDSLRMLTGVVVAMVVAAVFAGCTQAGVKERMNRAEAVMYA